MKFIPKQKMSKRQRAALNKQSRKTWEFSPITKVKQSKKIYDRKQKVKYE